jgi:hypothetical protein
MEFAYFSVSIIVAFALVRWATENIKFHIRNNAIWLHHWIISFLVMAVLLWQSVESPWIWGALTGVALEGLGRKNWSIMRNSGK